VKVLAKLGLVTAAAATVLFIFIYEFQGPVINKVMSEPPTVPAQTPTTEEVENTATAEESNVEIPEQPVELEVSPPAEIAEQTDLVQISEPVVEPEETPVTSAIPTLRVYGKITLATTGEQLGGVNIMVPGSTVAKISNPNGGYTIEVPESTREIVFIYRGKKLVQRISPGNSLVNVELDLETMEWE
jgi:hypothetical protein